MAYILEEVSRSFSEFLLIPRLTERECVSSNIDLRTIITKYGTEDKN